MRLVYTTKNKMKSNPIGIFDSGIGGLTVAKEIIDLLPNETIIYLGDTARVPYGTRGKAVILQFAKELVHYLLKQNVKALVVACNTISATCLEEIQAISPVPVIGVIKPVAKEVALKTKNKCVGVIGTRATINSDAYKNEIEAIDSSVEIISKACPLFVPIAEEGFGESKVSKVSAEEYLKDFRSTNIDYLVLGCTHYPLLRKVIQEVVGNNITLIDSGKATAFELRKTLEQLNFLNDTKVIQNKFLVTDAPQRVLEIASLFFGKEIFPKIEKIDLDNHKETKKTQDRIFSSYKSGSKVPSNLR